MPEISLKDLLEAGCHFGHQTTRWNPKMKPYIYTARDRIHIFDLVKTKEGLEEAANFAKVTAASGGQIVFIGTKRQAQEIIREAAKQVGMPYIVNRWVGGLITNWEQVKKRIDHLADLKLGKVEGRFKDRTKRENLLIDREIIKLEKVFGGVASLKEVPAAIFVIDARKEDAALREAKIRGVKTIAIVDTNVSPDNVDFVIPANDDASKSIQLITEVMVKAIAEGLKKPTVSGEQPIDVAQGKPAESSKQPVVSSKEETKNSDKIEEKPKKKVAKKAEKKEKPSSAKATEGKE